MINNKKYIELLKSMISCVSHGDYSSVKELSHLELERMKETEKRLSKEIIKAKRYKKPSKYKGKTLEEWENKDLTILVDNYSKYILYKIETTNDLKKLQNEVMSIHEFIEKI